MRKPCLHGNERDGMRATRWALLVVVVSAVAFGAVAAESVVRSVACAAGPPFKNAPEFATFDVDGNSRALSQYLNAKPILLEFMSPDCPHCVEMAPIIGRAHTLYGDKVQFLTVAYDKNVQRVQRFAQSEKHAWPYLMGTQQISRAYKLDGVPTFCFIAPGGQVVRYVVGSMPEKTLRENIDALLTAQ